MGYHNVTIYSDDTSLVIRLASAFQESEQRLHLARRRDEILSEEILGAVDIVLLDDRLAQVDTWNIAHQIRTQVQDRRVAIVGFVDQLDTELLMEGRRLGVDAFLLKRSIGPELVGRLDFVSRRVGRRDDLEGCPIFQPHGAFLQSLRELIDIQQVSPAATGATPGRRRDSRSSSSVVRFKGSSAEVVEEPGAHRVVPRLVGRTLGKAVVEREIGRGGGGAVFLGRHTSLDMEVAIKVLYPSLVERDPVFADQFLVEARTAARISDGAVVRVFDCDRDEELGLYYLIMEHIRGVSLEEEIQRSRRLGEFRLTEIAIETARCLTAAEDLGIIHRDIKPGNIILTSGGKVKVVDLGLAKRVGRSASVSTKGEGEGEEPELVGTPYYMSPEQIENPEIIDSRTDVYSLGVTLYHAITGEVPFAGKDLGEVLYHHLNTAPAPITSHRADVTPVFERMVLRMLAKDPDQRYRSCREVYGVLRDHRDHLLVARTQGRTEGRGGRRGFLRSWTSA